MSAFGSKAELPTATTVLSYHRLWARANNRHHRSEYSQVAGAVAQVLTQCLFCRKGQQRAKSGYAAVMRITEYEIYAFILGAGAIDGRLPHGMGITRLTDCPPNGRASTKCSILVSANRGLRCLSSSTRK